MLNPLLPKTRRGLPACPRVEAILARVLAGGADLEDLEILRKDAALSRLLGCSLPAAHTVRDVLESLHAPEVPALWPGPKVALPGEGERLEARRQLTRLAAERVLSAISADMSQALTSAVLALPEEAWRLEAEPGEAVPGEAVRWSAEVACVPDDGLFQKNRPEPPRELAVRILNKQGHLFADGSQAKPFCLVTPRPGDRLSLLTGHRGKAGSLEPTHDIRTILFALVRLSYRQDLLIADLPICTI